MQAGTKKTRVQEAVKREARRACALSDAIADYAELGFREFNSSRALAEYLDARAFDVRFPWRSMPTAFVATRGVDGPSIGILAEYDALPNCGAKEGTPGHGCGHNLLGVGAAVAAVAAAETMAAGGVKGRLAVWGCPAEELLAGKTFMTREGAFRGHDAVLAWHPARKNAVRHFGGSAMDSCLFEFFGQTAHGAYAHGGRSALDGVMLMDVAVNYLREHIPDNIRIHMAIRHGGDAPNVVPAYANAWYYIRGRTRSQVDDIRDRVMKCARGAAMATETRMKATRLTGVYDRLSNDGMTALLLENLKLFGAHRASARDRQKAIEHGGQPIFAKDVEDGTGEGPSMASSDEANVSWLAPLGVFNTACYSEGAAGHHRSLTAQVKLPFAHRGMLKAAEIMAGAAIDLCTDRGRLQAIGKEFRKATRKFTYDPLVGKRLKPLIDALTDP